jgi:ABC-type hemin transport system substrate-binding protein
MVDAFHRGHHLTYVKDASASHRLADMAAEDVHIAVARIIGLYGDVVRTETWIGARERMAARDRTSGTFAG